MLSRITSSRASRTKRSARSSPLLAHKLRRCYGVRTNMAMRTSPMMQKRSLNSTTAMLILEHQMIAWTPSNRRITTVKGTRSRLKSWMRTAMPSIQVDSRISLQTATNTGGYWPATDANGNFKLNDIAPSTYTLLVGDPEPACSFSRAGSDGRERIGASCPSGVAI
ncbi:hypothetical protein A8990_11244 [Paenibacillus taihuensis]|uniref:Carboxypeptidase family protein n=1 Tax=Paenibacillus taihuensis TaxID=1156355 RepID=A0A3D9RZ19_9BACL|nr:hypothetical protein A8990_11244 [Paenibacillus taihuensis]